MYKKRLIALLEGLECQHIDELIEESSEHLNVIGTEITKYMKLAIIRIDALNKIAILTNAIYSDGKDQGICGDDHTFLINDRIVKING